MTENVPVASESSGQSGHLPEDAIVIRGGQMRVRDMQASADVYEADLPGQYGLTFWSWPGLTADQIARRVGTSRLPHPVFRKCPVSRIHNLIPSDGRPLSLEKTYGPGHYTLFLPSPPTEEDFQRLSAIFDPPEPNPVAKNRTAERSE